MKFTAEKKEEATMDKEEATKLVKHSQPHGQEEETPSSTTTTTSSSSTNDVTGVVLLSAGLTIKTLDYLLSPTLKNNSVDFSPCNSPSLVSPPSSAFVSALQSPYISPRAITPKPAPPANNPIPSGPPVSVSISEKPTLSTHTLTRGSHPSPPFSDSYHVGSQSDDIPSSSYTPPSDQYEYSDDLSDSNLKFISSEPPPLPPRISFSFPVPRISFAKPSVSPSSSAATNSAAKLRSCDVYIGFHGQNTNLTRFCKWLKSELELQGIACFAADRTNYSDSQNHEIADRLICSVTFGLLVVTNSTFLNHFSMEELRFFSHKKNLIPLFFDTRPAEITRLFLSYNSVEDKEWKKEAMDGLMKSHHEFDLEANEGNWRDCVSRAATILRTKLGRKSVVIETDDVGDAEELPFQRNRYLVGREKEIMEIETALFGVGECCSDQDLPWPIMIKGEASGQSEGLADEESDVFVSTTTRGRYISLEMGNKCKEPKLEGWVEPVIGSGRASVKRSKYKKSSKIGNYKSLGSGVICINGIAGIGKTELALEFAYRYSQRYKMVLWVGGEARYLKQNILNMSLKLGLDVSPEAEVLERGGRIRSFEEQEMEAFKRVKREIFRDLPYLLIIDNLETEEWWEGKDLHDLIPRNTGGSHVIITTRLSKVMNFDTMQLPPLLLTDAMVLIRGRKKKEYGEDELEYLRKFDEKLGRLSYGLWVIGSLLSELGIPPSSLFQTIDQVPLDEAFPSSSSHISSSSSLGEEQYCKNNPFLMKIIYFCFVIIQQLNGGKNYVASRMLLVGSWFAPAPISSTLLATTARNMNASSRNGFHRKCTRKCLSLLSDRYRRCCLLGSQIWKSEEESVLLLVRLGLARRANKQSGSGCWIQLHPITQVIAKRKQGLLAAKATVIGVRKAADNRQVAELANLDHLWASAFLVFGFKLEPPLVQLKAIDMVLYIKRTALPLAIRAFTAFSRCSSALELLKVCTNALEEVEKSFVSQVQDWCHGSLCWKNKLRGKQRVDEYVWQDVTLLKATLLETRAKLLLRGGHFDSGEELCRTCISIRTVMLGHKHAQTLAAQETLAKLVRMRSKI